MKENFHGTSIKRRILEEEILLESLLALLDDASVLFSVDVTHDQVYLLNRVETEGFAFVSKVLPKFYKHVLRCMEVQLFTPFAGFRKQRGGRGLLPAFLQGWTSVFFDIHDGTLCRPVTFDEKERWGEAQRFLSTFCQGFGSKYEFDLAKDLYDKQVRAAIDLEDKIFDSSMLAQAACDENLPSWRPILSDKIVSGPFGSAIIQQNGSSCSVDRRDIVIVKDYADGGYKWSRIDREVTRLLEVLFRGFDPLDIRPCHGPGSVYEKTISAPHEKYFALVSNQFEHLYPSDTYFRPSPQTRLEPLSCSFMYDRNLWIERFAREVGGISRHRIVPKNAEKGRDINLEGTALMFLQKGLQKKLYAYLQHHPMLRTQLPNGKNVPCIGFDDQSVNQYWALLASQTREKATLDLKNASSFVGLSHVDRHMPKHMRECLKTLRSVYVEYAFKCKGRTDRGKSYTHVQPVLKTKTFAPMGSAICFPIEAVMFWAYSVAALHYLGSNEAVFVYGDDLIVPTRHARFVCQVLEHFGFKVNDTKSFIDGYFRESCGVDAYLGMNVSPIVRVKKPVPLKRDTAKPRKKDALSIDSEGAAGLVAWLDYSNRLYAKNYVKCAEFIRKVLRDNFRRIWKFIPRACDLSGRENHLGILDYTAKRLSDYKVPTPEPRFRPGKSVTIGPPQCPLLEYLSWTERRPPWFQDFMIPKVLFTKTPRYIPKDFDESRRYLRWVCEGGEDTSSFTLRNSVLLKLGPRYSS